MWRNKLKIWDTENVVGTNCRNSADNRQKTMLFMVALLKYVIWKAKVMRLTGKEVNHGTTKMRGEKNKYTEGK